MGRLGGEYSLGQVERALRDIGEVPKWQVLPRTQHQHKSTKFKAVVNIWTSRGTVLVQGGSAAQLEEALKKALGEPTEAVSAAGAGPPGQPAAGAAAAVAAAAAAASNAPAWHLFVDGSCPDNRNVRDRSSSPAGWGVAIYSPADAAAGPPDAAPAKFELFGPVVVDSASALSLGADVGSNNTGELSAIGEALLWLRDEAPEPASAPAVLHYDSDYAANITQGKYRAHKNQKLAECVQQLWKEVGQRRPLRVSHVKGHSGCPGNELADRLAAQGATGSFSQVSTRWCRFPGATAASAGAISLEASRLAATQAGGGPPVPEAPAPARDANPYAEAARRLATSSAHQAPAAALASNPYAAAAAAAAAPASNPYAAAAAGAVAPASNPYAARAAAAAVGSSGGGSGGGCGSGTAPVRGAPAEAAPERPPKRQRHSASAPAFGGGVQASAGGVAQAEARVLCGPYEGMSLAAFARAQPAECARYTAALQALVCQAGQLDALRSSLGHGGGGDCAAAIDAIDLD